MLETLKDIVCWIGAFYLLFHFCILVYSIAKLFPKQYKSDLKNIQHN
jgi:hypothetical protein